MSGLTMPRKGEAARLLADLNAEHAPPAPETPENAAPVSNERYSVTALQETLESSPQETGKAAQKVSRARGQKPSRDAASPRSERGERVEKALQIARGDELTVATIRVSAKLHDYLERYVARINRINPKAKYRKQDAIEAAFAAFYADHPLPPAPAEDEEL